jgi:hypothetical protein
MSSYTEDDNEKSLTGTEALVQVINQLVQDAVSKAMHSFRASLGSEVKAKLNDMRPEIAKDVMEEMTKSIKTHGDTTRR